MEAIGSDAVDRVLLHLTTRILYLIFAIFLSGSMTVPEIAGWSALISWLDYQGAAARRERLEKLWAKELREFRTVDPVDLANYKDFLSSSKTGIFRLLPNLRLRLRKKTL